MKRAKCFKFITIRRAGVASLGRGTQMRHKTLKDKANLAKKHGGNPEWEGNSQCSKINKAAK